MQVSKREYVTHGSVALGERLADELRAAGKNPYVVPVGGSNALGCWGYMMALEELANQTPTDERFTHIVMVCCQSTVWMGCIFFSSILCAC